MDYLKQNYRKKKHYNLIQFMLLALLPIVGVTVIFVYAFLQVKKDVDFTQKQLTGLYFIEQVEESVFNLQLLRGLSAIKEYKSQKEEEHIDVQKQNLQSIIITQFDTLSATLSKNNSEEIMGLQAFLSEFEKDIINADFEVISDAINELKFFSRDLSYQFNLKLESSLRPHMMVENAVYFLPSIIEYNAQLKSKASSVVNNALTKEQKEHIRVQLAKMNERLKEIKFNNKIISSDEIYPDIHNSFKKMITAQNDIVSTVNREFLDVETINFSGKEIYDVITANMMIIIDFQRLNFSVLRDVLTNRLEQKSFLLYGVVFAGVASLLFIVYVNLLFYRENKKLIGMVEKISITDGLTQLYNRRAFDLNFDMCLKLSKREKKTLAFMIMDIDFFKQYNDTYGHQAGDEALIKVAMCLSKNLKRKSDEVFRLGGEEFGALAFGVDKEEAFEFAQSLRESVEKLQIKHEHNSASEFVTLSIGVCIIDSHQNGDTKYFYQCADKALYEAKESGRNRVVVHDD